MLENKLFFLFFLFICTLLIYNFLIHNLLSDFYKYVDKNEECDDRLQRLYTPQSKHLNFNTNDERKNAQRSSLSLHAPPQRGYHAFNFLASERIDKQRYI